MHGGLLCLSKCCGEKFFERNRALIVDEFLYCYKPFEISQSYGFYQFSTRSSNCRLVKSLPTSNRRWKTEFSFVSRFWEKNPVEVGRDPLPPYTGKMGHLRPKGMLFPTLCFISLYHTCLIYFFYFLFYSYETTCSVQIPP